MDPVVYAAGPWKRPLSALIRPASRPAPRPVTSLFPSPPPGPAGHRAHPIAWSVALDRSGSMSGEPLASALRAATAVVQNLRRKAPFGLITFDDDAEVVIPMGPVSNQPAVLDRIDPAAAPI